MAERSYTFCRICMSHLSGILVELRKAPAGSAPGEDSAYEGRTAA
jgi:hypothetical protein